MSVQTNHKTNSTGNYLGMCGDSRSIAVVVVTVAVGAAAAAVVVVVAVVAAVAAAGPVMVDQLAAQHLLIVLAPNCSSFLKLSFSSLSFFPFSSISIISGGGLGQISSCQATGMCSCHLQPKAQSVQFQEYQGWNQGRLLVSYNGLPFFFVQPIFLEHP